MSAGEPEPMDLRDPMPGNGSRPSLFENGLRASGMTIPLGRQPVANGGNPVRPSLPLRAFLARFCPLDQIVPAGPLLTGRRTSVVSRLLAFAAAVRHPPRRRRRRRRRGRGRAGGVLLDFVAVLLGQRRRRWRRVTLTRPAAGAHLERLRRRPTRASQTHAAAPPSSDGSAKGSYSSLRAGVPWS